jgi:hypothetical protein
MLACDCNSGGGIDIAIIGAHNELTQPTYINFDHNYHSYAIDVKGNVITYIVDGAPQLSVTDNQFLSPGLIGLWSGGVQLEVSSFTVVTL